uniref:protein-serine/threonine phosphatase n=1 Tax=Chenopodium quinoa TaxID=63459 RepID=A0A803MST6_CHEQI
MDNICSRTSWCNTRIIDCGDPIKLPFRYIHPNLALNLDEVTQIQNDNTQVLLNRKKLHLVLDLDHTLIHARKIKKSCQHRQNIRAMMYDDISEFQLSNGNEFVAKLRPGVHEFLEKVSTMFDLSILCTMGKREYAHKVVEKLCGLGKFLWVISREDCVKAKQKMLDVVLSCREATLVVDDTESVWEESYAPVPNSCLVLKLTGGLPEAYSGTAALVTTTGGTNGADNNSSSSSSRQSSKSTKQKKSSNSKNSGKGRQNGGVSAPHQSGSSSGPNYWQQQPYGPWAPWPPCPYPNSSWTPQPTAPTSTPRPVGSDDYNFLDYNPLFYHLHSPNSTSTPTHIEQPHVTAPQATQLAGAGLRNAQPNAASDPPAANPASAGLGTSSPDGLLSSPGPSHSPTLTIPQTRILSPTGLGSAYILLYVDDIILIASSDNLRKQFMVLLDRELARVLDILSDDHNGFYDVGNKKDEYDKKDAREELEKVMISRGLGCSNQEQCVKDEKLGDDEPVATSKPKRLRIRLNGVLLQHDFTPTTKRLKT